MSDVPPASSGGGMNTDALIQQALAGLDTNTTNAGVPQTPGVDQNAIGGYYDPDFFNQVPEGPTNVLRSTGRQDRRPRRPHYQRGHEWRLLQSIPPETLPRLQERLYTVGLLDEYRPGQFDADGTTINAVKDLMAIANRTGNDWDSALTDLETKVANGSMVPLNDSGSKMTVPEFTSVPDTATLKNKVNRSMRDLIGRDATQAEMRLFTSELMSDYEARAQQAFTQQTSTREIDPNVGAGRVTTQEQIDPEARFEQSLRERMAGDIRTIERQAGVQGGAQSARASIAATDQITGT